MNHTEEAYRIWFKYRQKLIELNKIIEDEFKMKLSEKQRRFTYMIGLLIEWAFTHRYELTGGEWYRTKEQAEWYAKKLEKGKRSKGIRNSKHCVRLAVDFNLFINGVYQTKTKAYEKLGKQWECLGGTWGGRFKRKDGNHFEFNGEVKREKLGSNANFKMDW